MTLSAFLIVMFYQIGVSPWNFAYTVADKTGAQNIFSAFNYHCLLMVIVIVMKLYKKEDILAIVTYVYS